MNEQRIQVALDINQKFCFLCGKEFYTSFPDSWAYKTDASILGHRRLFCSWKCLRAYEKEEELNKEMKRKITPKNKRKAIEIAISGGDPLEYLRECGSSAPEGGGYIIKKGLKGSDPETYDMLPEKYKPAAERKKVEVPEVVPDVKIDGAIRIETPEANRIEVVQVPERPPVMEYKTTGISTPIGDWQYFRKQGYLDWTPLDGNGPVSMSLEEWRELMRLFPEIRKVLEVEMDE